MKYRTCRVCSNLSLFSVLSASVRVWPDLVIVSPEDGKAEGVASIVVEQITKGEFLC